jgi:hypothetical protein
MTPGSFKVGGVELRGGVAGMGVDDGLDDKVGGAWRDTKLVWLWL